MSRRKTSAEWELTRSRFQIPDKYPPQPRRKERQIGDVLSDIMKNESPIEETLPEELTSHWPLITGPQISKHTKPAYVKNKTLYVYVDHPGWLTEVRRLQKNLLLKKLSSIQILPDIQNIQFQLDPTVRTRKNRKK